MKSYKVYVGIHPGMSGAIATISTLSSGMVDVYPIPIVDKSIDVQKLIGRIPFPDENIEVVACIEKVWKPISLVRMAGIIEGVCLSLDIPTLRVSASTWRKEVLGISNATKQDAIDYCIAKYPDVNLYRTERSRTYDDNFAEAICIAEFCMLYNPTY